MEILRCFWKLFGQSEYSLDTPSQHSSSSSHTKTSVTSSSIVAEEFFCCKTCQTECMRARHWCQYRHRALHRIFCAFFLYIPLLLNDKLSKCCCIRRSSSSSTNGWTTLTPCSVFVYAPLAWAFCVFVAGYSLGKFTALFLFCYDDYLDAVDGTEMYCKAQVWNVLYNVTLSTDSIQATLGIAILVGFFCVRILAAALYRKCTASSRHKPPAAAPPHHASQSSTLCLLKRILYYCFCCCCCFCLRAYVSTSRHHHHHDEDEADKLHDHDTSNSNILLPDHLFGQPQQQPPQQQQQHTSKDAAAAVADVVVSDLQAYEQEFETKVTPRRQNSASVSNNNNNSASVKRPRTEQEEKETIYAVFDPDTASRLEQVSIQSESGSVYDLDLLGMAESSFSSSSSPSSSIYNQFPTWN